MSEGSDQFAGEIVSLIFEGVIALIVYLRYRYASSAASVRYFTFPPRFWAAIVDGLVLWPVGFFGTAFLSFGWPTWLIAIIVLIQDLAWFVYTVGMHARWGQTVGKMITKVKLLDFKEECPVTIYQAIVREAVPLVLGLGGIGWQMRLILGGQADKFGQPTHDSLWVESLVLAIPTIWFVAEIVTMFANDKRRALHDLIAGTVVVRTNSRPVDGAVEVPPNQPSNLEAGTSE